MGRHKGHAHTKASKGEMMVASTHKFPAIVQGDKVKIKLSQRKAKILSHEARKQGKRRAYDICETKASGKVWAPPRSSLLMPVEQLQDSGWIPGPLCGAVPKVSELFKGATAGVVNQENQELKHDTNAYFYVTELVTPEIQKLVMGYTADAVEVHCAQKLAAG
jgi:hypothetical protein